MSDSPGAQDSGEQSTRRPSLFAEAAFPASKSPSLSVLDALSASTSSAPAAARPRALWLGLGVGGAAMAAFAVMLFLKDITPGHEPSVASAPLPVGIEDKATSVSATPPVQVALGTAAPAASAPSSPLARLEELPAEAPAVLAAGAGAVAVGALATQGAGAGVPKPSATATTATTGTAAEATERKTTATRTAQARTSETKERREARKARELREARAVQQARATRTPARANAPTAAPVLVAAGAAGAATAAGATVGARPGDADVDLIAALVQHMNREGQQAEGGEPTIADLVKRCRALPGADAQRCLRRICENYWGRAEACPRSAAAAEVAARP